MLVIRSFNKKYHDKLILEINSLTLSSGVHILKGDNGSGKTTFFKCLAGIIPFSGEITLDDLSKTQHPLAYRYHVNYSEAEPVYPPFLTARDVMHFVAETKKAAPWQIDYYCRELGIEWFFKKSCGTYSSGMLKKLSLAIAFLGNPKMIIMDEPLITLDEPTQTQLFKLIRERKESILLLSSHQSIDQSTLNIRGNLRIEDNTLIIESGNDAAQ